MSLLAVRRMNVQLATEQLEDTDQNKLTLHCWIHFLNRPTDSKTFTEHTNFILTGERNYLTTPFSEKDKSKDKIKNGRGQRKSDWHENPGDGVGVIETSESVWQLKLFKANCWTFILDADIKDWENTEGGEEAELTRCSNPALMFPVSLQHKNKFAPL